MSSSAGGLTSIHDGRKTAEMFPIRNQRIIFSIQAQKSVRWERAVVQVGPCGTESVGLTQVTMSGGGHGKTLLVKPTCEA